MLRLLATLLCVALAAPIQTPKDIDAAIVIEPTARQYVDGVKALDDPSAYMLVGVEVQDRETWIVLQGADINFFVNPKLLTYRTWDLDGVRILEFDHHGEWSMFLPAAQEQIDSIGDSLNMRMPDPVLDPVGVTVCGCYVDGGVATCPDNSDCDNVNQICGNTTPKKVCKYISRAQAAMEDQ